MSDIVICRSTDELIRRAKKEHSDKTGAAFILCVAYKPLITFDNALILTTLLEDTAK